MSALALQPAVDDWYLDLRRDDGASRDAGARLSELLFRAARFEVLRRRGSLPDLALPELEELARDAAGDAAVSILRRLDDFRGESRFETWAYKFALLEAAVKVRRRVWREREVKLGPERWASLAAAGDGPDAEAEQSALLAAVRDGIENVLTPHQRDVLVGVVLDGVPIDVLADRLGSNRNALYKTIHDARRRLREHLAAAGHTELTG